jgi:uncharacterized protein YndB with AHSA1/START domain
VTLDPLNIAFEVDCPADHAFRVWTERTTTWWPVSHTTNGEPGSTVTFEPFAGGRVFERDAAGDEFEWGEVLEWEPPRRLVYLWHIRADRADATEVEITFAEAAPGRCRVEIEHRGWERLGAEGQPWRDRNMGGWATLLPHYLVAAGDASALRLEHMEEAT